MLMRWYGGAVIVLLFLGGCTSIHTKPVEVDMPTADRHFIVTIAVQRGLS
jgi:hypothetical protein